MTYKITYNPISPTSFKNSQLLTINVLVEWDVTDDPLTGSETFNIELGAPTAPAGAVGGVGGATLPLTFKMSSGSLDLVNRSAKFRLSMKPLAEGQVNLNGYISTSPLNKYPYSLNIYSGNIELSTKGFDKRIIPVADNDKLDVTADEKFKATLVVKAMTSGATPAPVPGAEIDIRLENVAPSMADQAGRFFDMSTGTPKEIVFNSQTQGSTTTFKLNANAQGEATLVVVSNTRPGFLLCHILGGVLGVTPARLYIYKEPAGVTAYEAPNIGLPFGKIAEYTTPEKGNSFPIDVNADITDDQYCVVILNDKYQMDQKGSAFNSNLLKVDGNIDDLNVSSDGADNEVFYAVSNNGQLIDSQLYKFKVESGNNKPSPNRFIVGPLVEPPSSVMTIGSLTANDNKLQITIPLSADKLALLKAGKNNLVSPNSYVVYARAKGWDSTGEFYDSGQLSFVQTITDYNAVTDTKKIDIIQDFSGLGRSPDSQNDATWELWYSYFDGANGTGNKIAESIHTTGKLETRDL